MDAGVAVVSGRGARIEMMPAGRLRPMARNAKRHDLSGIMASLRRFGFVAPVVLDDAGRCIVAGHGRVAAVERMREAEEPAPKGVMVRGDQWLVPVVRGVRFKTAREREAYSLADNQLTIVGGWDDGELEAALRDVADVTGTGFDQAWVDELVEAVTEDLEEAGSARSESVTIEATRGVVVVRVGTIKVEVLEGRYKRWIAKVKAQVGADPQALANEVVKRLGM